MIRKWLKDLIIEALNSQFEKDCISVRASRDPNENDNRLPLATVWENKITGYKFILNKKVSNWEPFYDEKKDVKKEVQDIDRRLCRIEETMASKDCCMLKDGN